MLAVAETVPLRGLQGCLLAKVKHPPTPFKGGLCSGLIPHLR